jgi:hypothetical protein
MSVQSRKRAAEPEAELEAEAADTRARIEQLAWLTALARAAVPVARTAGMTARDGARSAATWAAPRINGARAWTAPRIEQSGLAIRDTIAPRVCETLTAAARRVDVTAASPEVTAPRRRWPQVVAATAVLAAAVGAATAVVLRRLQDDRTSEADTGPSAAPDGRLRAGADGSGEEEDVSRPSSAT